MLLASISLSAFGQYRDGDVTCSLTTAEDVTGRRTFAEVLATPTFFIQENLRERKNLGYSRSHFWTRVTCRNSGMQTWAGIAEIDYSLLDTVDVYEPESAEAPLFRAGDHVPFWSRLIHYRHPAIPLVVPPGSEKSVYVRVASSGSVQLPMKLRNYNGFLSWLSSEYFLLGIYNGVVGVIFLIIVSLAVNLRERFYIWQLCYIATFHLLQVTVNGLGFQFFWSGGIWFNNHGPLILAAWSSAFAILFSREYLSTRLHFPRLDRAILGVALGLLALPLLGLVLPQNTLNSLASPMGLLISVLLTLLGLISIPRGVTSAGYFVAGWACMLTGIFVASMKGMGLLPISPLTNYAMQIGGLLEMTLLAVGFTWRIKEAERARKEIELSWQAQVKENVKLEAIAKTAQLLAHDIRRPFSIVKIASNLLKRSQSPTDIASVLEKIGPQLSKSETSIDLMLQDLLEATARPSTFRVDTDVRSLIEAMLNGFDVVAVDKSVRIETEFGHSAAVSIDPVKIQRVIGNILQNAFQAVPPHGRIWIKSKDLTESGRQFVAVEIGNSGSFIDEALLERVFDMHFSAGKSGGTGLGLAIARKIVNEHEGRIICRSDAERGTEFVIFLPAAVVTANNEAV